MWRLLTSFASDSLMAAHVQDRLLGLVRVQGEVVAIEPFNSLLYAVWSPPEMTLMSSVNFWMVLSTKDTASVQRLPA